MTRAELAKANRLAMPKTASEVAAWRAVFGAGVRVVWAEEDGRRVGVRTTQRSMDVDQWQHYIKTGERPE